MKVSQLINKPEKWAKNCLAKDSNGKSLNEIGSLYEMRYAKDGSIWYDEQPNKDIKSYSLQGAVSHCYQDQNREFVMENLRNTIYKYSGKVMSVGKYNDDPETKWVDIEKIIRYSGV